MKSLLVFVCLPLLLQCQSRDYFFVPTMKAYNRLLCQSGLPGTEHPLVCPQNAVSMYDSIKSDTYIPRRNLRSGHQNNVINEENHSYLLPVVPLRTPKGEEAVRSHQLPKKIYMIPWESQYEKPIVNYILVPDDLLNPDAPLDTLDGEDRFERPQRKQRSEEKEEEEEEVPETRKRSHYSSHSHSVEKIPVIYHKRKVIERIVTPDPKKSKRFRHHHESAVKHYRTVDSGHDSGDYDDSANE